MTITDAYNEEFEDDNGRHIDPPNHLTIPSVEHGCNHVKVVFGRPFDGKEITVLMSTHEAEQLAKALMGERVIL